MMPRVKFRILIAALPLCAALAAQAATVGHRIEAHLDPAAGTLAARDTLRLPEAMPAQAVFVLHAGLAPRVSTGEARLERVGRDGHLEAFRLIRSAPGPVTLAYEGRIRHELDAVQDGMGRAREQSLGTIAEEGVFLGGHSGWYPRFADRLQTLSLEAVLPPGWLAVSQGAGPGLEETADGVRVRWEESQPQDALYLIAAPFTLYRQDTDHGEAQAFLRHPDAELAERYLQATEEYLARYSALIGDYPYAKFALVENFWETGYGMPSFTLLGPRVLRLPFILHSSYPHEILHNWWGNGVFVGAGSGNWSEGLTAYLADHLNQAIEGRGSAYRRDQLKAYAAYVRDADDLPLTAFRGRHGSASQAIGYGKALMLFHMLRIRLGDDAFRTGLQRFYADNRFRRTGYAELAAAFDTTGDGGSSAFIEAWTTRVGAPRLALDELTAERTPQERWRLHGRLRQVQEAAPFPLTVPVVIHDRDGRATQRLIALDGRSAAFEIRLDAEPVRVAADPGFDTFRLLAAGEAPVTLSNLFGAERGLIVLPEQAPEAFAAGYRALAQAWQRGQDGWRIAGDSELERLPDDRAVWLLGWDNRWLDELAAAGERFAPDPPARRLEVLGESYERLSAVLTARAGEAPIGWLAASEPRAIAGLARKVPHYGKYGYLLFAGEAPENRVKEQWPAGDSALTRWLSSTRPAALEQPPRPTLITP